MTTSQVLPPRATHFSIVFFPGHLLLNLLFMQPCYPHEHLSAVYQSILQHLATDFPGRQHDKKMLKAAISLAFHGLLRASEFTSPTTVSYNLKKISSNQTLPSTIIPYVYKSKPQKHISGVTDKPYYQDAPTPPPAQFPLLNSIWRLLTTRHHTSLYSTSQMESS